MAEFDYRRQAYELAGKGYEEHVNTVAEELHYNESLHMHNLGVEKKHHGKCEYCWLRAGRAVRALAKGGLVAPFYEGQLDTGMTPKPGCNHGPDMQCVSCVPDDGSFRFQPLGVSDGGA